MKTLKIIKNFTHTNSNTIVIKTVFNDKIIYAPLFAALQYSEGIKELYDISYEDKSLKLDFIKEINFSTLQKIYHYFGGRNLKIYDYTPCNEWGEPYSSIIRIEIEIGELQII